VSSASASVRDVPSVISEIFTARSYKNTPFAEGETWAAP
jgi:hypothetical protein